jgi:5-methyltetrahydrofolate--homocysteine methyltransferase
LLVDKVGFPAAGTSFSIEHSHRGDGIDEHNNYAVNFIEAADWIKENLPHAK